MKRIKFVMLWFNFLMILIIPTLVFAEVKDTRVGGPLTVRKGDVDIDKLKTPVIISEVRLKPIKADHKDIQIILWNYYFLINELVELVNDKAVSQVSRGTAAYILGNLRAENAAYALVKNLPFKDSVSLDERPNINDVDYPIASALVKIGKPSITPLLKRLSVEEKDEVRALCVKIVEEIEGMEGAQAYIVKFLAKEEDKTHKVHLEKALGLLKGK